MSKDRFPGNNFNGLGSSPPDRHTLLLDEAIKIADNAAQQAEKIGVPMCIAIVDPSGALIEFHKQDNAMPACIDIAIKKAKTVALFNGAFTTSDLKEMSAPDGALTGIEQTNGGLVAFGGGLPLSNNGFFVGAIGVSGGAVEQDVDVAQAGAFGWPLAPKNGDRRGSGTGTRRRR